MLCLCPICTTIYCAFVTCYNYDCIKSLYDDIRIIYENPYNIPPPSPPLCRRRIIYRCRAYWCNLYLYIPCIFFCISMYIYTLKPYKNSLILYIYTLSLYIYTFTLYIIPLPRCQSVYYTNITTQKNRFIICDLYTLHKFFT